MRRPTATICLTISVLLGSAGVSFAVPQCKGSYNNNTWTNCVGVYTFPDGTKYIGAFYKNKFHGKGTVVSPTRRTVVCEFANGKVKGKCVSQKPKLI